MPSQIPAAIHAQKYISLTTFRKTGVGVPTPVWFGEQDGKLYVMTRSDMGKAKRIRNNPQVKVAPCTIRGKVTGPEFAGAGLAFFLRNSIAARVRHWIANTGWRAFPGSGAGPILTLRSALNESFEFQVSSFRVQF
jgi:PPOX class probable F420-dependent enzyme